MRVHLPVLDELDDEPEDEPSVPAHASCALDIADGGPRTLEQVALVISLTRERVRQIVNKAFARPGLREALQVFDDEG